jgi:hypothetical protein
MKALMGLAWKRCAKDIFDVIRIMLGGLLFMLMFLIFTIMNFINWFAPLPALAPSTEFTQLSALYISATWGYINTLSFGVFLAIIVCLIEYTMSFLHVAYYYDNCSWEIPKQIRLFFGGISKWVSTTRAASHAQNEKDTVKDKYKLMTDIYKIRDDSVIRTVQPIVQNKKED